MQTSEFSLELSGTKLNLGEERDIFLKVSETYIGRPIEIPVRVLVAPKPGPKVFIAGAIHGDELNGTGIIHEIILKRLFQLTCGSLILIPVVNILGFERHSRYLPDRRDLNRCFPGGESGSPGNRLAHLFFSEVVRKCDFGIDLHTASVRRTNYPSIRGDLHNSEVLRLAEAFGSEVMINKNGPKGSLRREATLAGCPTITFEGGEVWKIEPGVVEAGLRGIRNVLIKFGMLEGEAIKAPYQARVNKTRWVRVNSGGLLKFHVAPGQITQKGQALCTVTDVFGGQETSIVAPTSGIVVGMTTLPVVKPGNPVCHLAKPVGSISKLKKTLDTVSEKSPAKKVRRELKANVRVEAQGEIPGNTASEN